ncbi:MAG: VOC family protein [bacterium]
MALHASEIRNSDRDDPQKLPAGRRRPGLSVPNLDAFHKRMVEMNVPPAKRGRRRTFLEAGLRSTSILMGGRNKENHGNFFFI